MTDAVLQVKTLPSRVSKLGGRRRFRLLPAKRIDEAGSGQREQSRSSIVRGDTYNYGGIIAHVVTFSAFRRSATLKILEKPGVNSLGYRDLIEWEREVAGC